MFPKSLTLFLSRGDIVPKARQVFLIFQLQLSRVPDGFRPMGVVGSLILWIFQKYKQGPIMDPCLDQVVYSSDWSQSK